MARLKPADPAVCPQCGAVYQAGRWHWGPRPVEAAETLCQACHRIADRCPAGVVTLGGDYVRAHRDGLLALIRQQESLEKADHPLNRIMEVRDIDGGLEVTTTDIHLPRRIGEALRRRHAGDVTFQYDEDGYFARVNWRAA